MEFISRYLKHLDFENVHMQNHYVSQKYSCTKNCFTKTSISKNSTVNDYPGHSHPSHMTVHPISWPTGYGKVSHSSLEPYLYSDEMLSISKSNPCQNLIKARPTPLLALREFCPGAPWTTSRTDGTTGPSCSSWWFWPGCCRWPPSSSRTSQLR